jgi:hypothetical protein
VRSGSLETDPVGEAIARCHVQDLKLPLAAALEIRGITFVLGPDCFSALAIASRWLEEGGRRVASDDLTEWSGIAANVGERNLATLLHELLKIVLIVVHSVSPQRYFSHVFVDGLKAHWYYSQKIGL